MYLAGGGTARAKLGINGCVTPHFKSGLRQADAMRVETGGARRCSPWLQQGTSWEIRCHGHHGNEARHRRDIGPPACRSGRIVSHKWMTVLSASISSFRGRSGASPVRKGTGSVPVVPGAWQGSGQGVYCQPIDSCATMYSD